MGQRGQVMRWGASGGAVHRQSGNGQEARELGAEGRRARETPWEELTSKGRHSGALRETREGRGEKVLFLLLK